MREPLFLKNNKDKWLEFEENLFGAHSETTDPDELANLYIQVTDDLAYSRTFYPHSKVVKYLNGLAARTHILIYKNKKSNRSLKEFIRHDLPLAFYRGRLYLLVAFLVFVGSCLAGWFSTLADPETANLFLGDGYVEMTLENIKNGDPTGVYKDDDALSMFQRIAINNIYVSFRVFVFGLMFMFGAIRELFINGFMVGTFLALFYNHNSFADAFPVVMIHGTLELSAIAIAGAAGMYLAGGFMFPGTYTRMESFRRAAKESAKMMIGLVPVFTVAAFLESYVTRHSGMPLILKLLILGLSAAYIVYYYVILPHLLFSGKVLEEEELI